MYRPGDSVLLDCPLEGDLQGYEILWLSPRFEHFLAVSLILHPVQKSTVLIIPQFYAYFSLG